MGGGEQASKDNNSNSKAETELDSCFHIVTAPQSVSALALQRAAPPLSRRGPVSVARSVVQVHTGRVFTHLCESPQEMQARPRPRGPFGFPRALPPEPCAAALALPMSPLAA